MMIFRRMLYSVYIITTLLSIYGGYIYYTRPWDILIHPNIVRNDIVICVSVIAIGLYLLSVYVEVKKDTHKEASDPLQTSYLLSILVGLLILLFRFFQLIVFKLTH